MIKKILFAALIDQDGNEARWPGYARVPLPGTEALRAAFTGESTTKVTKPMTPESLRAWRQRMRWTKALAARELGLSSFGYFAYETGKPMKNGKPTPIPKTVALACAAITHRLEPEE